MNLHQFRFVQEAVRRNLNLTEVAKTLHTSQPGVSKAILELEKKFPTIPVVTVDERYSSKNAVRAMVEMGMKKVDRRDKKNIDLVAATMLLQEYLSYRS